MVGLRAQDAKVYRFSPVNQWNIELTAKYWNPIIEHVSRKSGVKLELKIGRTSADTTAYVLAQEVEFIFSNHMFSPEREKLGWKVFGRRNAPPIHAQIVVSVSSPIVTVDQLAGHEIAFAGPEAFIGYKVPSAHLISLGIPVKNVLFASEMIGAVRGIDPTTGHYYAQWDDSDGVKVLFEHLDLTVVWAFVIAFAIFAYIVMDGFDLGIGILFPTLRPGEERDTAMNSVAPVWDGNETWLVLGGIALLAAFPLAFAIILPAVYFPILIMLLALVFRGVAFEFRFRTRPVPVIVGFDSS